MRLRRRIASPRLKATPNLACKLEDQIRKLRPAEWGSGVELRGRNPEPHMSQMGQPLQIGNVRDTYGKSLFGCSP
jgi:hypothetical protein